MEDVEMKWHLHFNRDREIFPTRRIIFYVTPQIK